MITRIRAATPDDAAGLARVHVDAWRIAYRALLPQGLLDGLSYEAREQRWRDQLAQAASKQFTVVAEDGTRGLMGFASGGPERDGTPGYDGEIYAVYVLPQRWRTGTGRCLMTACARALLDRGFSAAMLWVLEKNTRARAFYEALGGQLIGQKSAVIGDAPVIEVAYGWKDVNLLCS